MFTGIIEATGQIAKMESRGGDKVLTINVGKLDMSDVKLGDSIACNGVCLTAIDFNENTYIADVSGETLKLSTLGALQVGAPVNLEKALTPSSRLGGHIVSGHVDGIGEIVGIANDSRSVQFDIQAPADLARYIAKKGSITVDGVSLTVNEVEQDIFKLNLVPHTLQETTASHYKVGHRVNLEVDLLARYLERLLQGKAQSQPDRLNYELLVKSGFIK
ncbi:riboflavin synthase [Aliikangiella maris]|uniref:Riboflavin synthase n=2 Tax=Aliikangiella maris TaxID=3162458 RepID=A0ABV3MTY4_9GAMM